MLLDKSKIIEPFDRETEFEQWRNVRSILASIEMVENKEEIVKNSIITGIMYSKLYTKWEEDEGSSKVATVLKKGSKLSLELYEFLSRYLIFYPEYSNETLTKDIAEYEGVIIYEQNL